MIRRAASRWEQEVVGGRQDRMQRKNREEVESMNNMEMY